MRFRLLILGLVALTCVPPLRPASASCAAPVLTVRGQESVRPPVLRLGAPITVTGTFFVDECGDTGTSYPGGIGCSGGNDHGRTPKGLPHVRLVLLHGTQKPSQLELGTEDADKRGRVSWDVTVPRNAPTGPSYLKADLSEPLPVVIRP